MLVHILQLAIKNYFWVKLDGPLLGKLIFLLYQRDQLLSLFRALFSWFEWCLSTKVFGKEGFGNIPIMALISGQLRNS
uniref:Uncharacterized protein n=1 Tax=Rhizophora mucronata TaxID=61149 RepID=A0A2P2P9W2_RHIMU